MNQQVRSLKPGQRIDFADPALKAQYGDAGLTHRHGGELYRHNRKIVALDELPADVVLLNGIGERVDMYNNGEVVPGSVATSNIVNGVIDKSGRTTDLRCLRSRGGDDGDLNFPDFLFSSGGGQGYDNPYVNTETGYRNPSCYHTST